MKTYRLILMLVVLGMGHAHAANFFTIQRIEYHQRAPRKGPAIFNTVEKEGLDKKIIREQVFVPCVEVDILVQEQTKAADVFAKAYFYDKSGNLIEKVAKPVQVRRGKDGQYALPIFLPKAKTTSIFFPVPEAALQETGWQVLVVFGDQQGAHAHAYPLNEPSKLDYPEKPLVEEKPSLQVARKAAMDPVVEHVVRTGNKKQPQITLFMRPPLGMTDAKEAKGVLAMCLLANSVGDVKLWLQGVGAKPDVNGLMEFAEKNKLIILCWGSKSLWNPGKNWDEQSQAVNREMDETFDDVAAAWAQGVKELTVKYGIPDKKFLLWGLSGSAQYACRLALRKPEYFLAVHVHVPSSFDKPTPEANRVLWCLTTGELESGYERSQRFYAQCRELGYPMVYKAFVGLGHAVDARADSLGLKFFEYAINLREEREAFDKQLKERSSPLQAQKEEGPLQPWPESFRTPAFVGDMVNQEVFALAEQDMVPTAFRVALPTKKVAERWSVP